MNLKSLFILIIVTPLLSCETIATKQEVKNNYSGLTVTQFVKARYTDKLSAFLSKIPSENKSINDYTNQVLSDGRTVIYPANYTGMNDEFLYKPAKELKEFCEVNHGKFYLKKEFHNKISGLYSDPSATYFSVLNSNLPQSIDVPELIPMVFGQYSTMSVPLDKKEMAFEAAIDAIRDNNRSAAVLYRIASNHGAFGVYACYSPLTKQVKWGVMIKPIAYSPRDPNNQLTADTLYLQITPIAKKVKA